MSERSIAILTSGGDSPGMNAAIATIVKAARKATAFGLKREVPVYGVRRGYKGLQEGDIVSLDELSIAGIMRSTGTVLGSARLPKLKDAHTEEEFARIFAREAAETLGHYQVGALIVLGGDGSFKGASRFFNYCWNACLPLAVIGIPCSIDNDIPGTDYSIGTDTAINSTMELMDNLVGTAYSHGRTFLVETMGAKAGYLALMAALTGEAEAVFVPEDTPPRNWRERLARELRIHFRHFDLKTPPDFWAEGERRIKTPTALWPQKEQATVVFAEGFNREQELLAREKTWQKAFLATPNDLPRPRANDLRKRLREIVSHTEPARTQHYLECWDRSVVRPQDVPPFECRTSVPGHVVRGAVPTARDRILARLFAIRAMKCIAECWNHTQWTSPPQWGDIQGNYDILKQLKDGSGLAIGIRGNFVRQVLLSSVTGASTELKGQCDKRRVFYFQHPLKLVKVLGGRPRYPRYGKNYRRIGIMTVGADAPGMNAAVRAVTRTAIARGVEPWGIRNGYIGLLKAGESAPDEWSDEELQFMGVPEGERRHQARRLITEKYLKRYWQDSNRPCEHGLTEEVIDITRSLLRTTTVRDFQLRDVLFEALRKSALVFQMNWMDVNNIAKRPGSILGSVRSQAIASDDFQSADDECFPRMHEKLQRWNLEGLIVIGGLKELKIAHLLWKSKNIPLVTIPATIDNDIPGTYYSIGADTALNAIVEAADRVMATAAANYRVFVIEVMGRLCGYLAMMAAIAGAAENVLLPEEPLSLKELESAANHLQREFKHRRRHGLVICQESASGEMKPSEVASAIATAGRGFFETRFVQLGHLQRGATPTAFDRELGSRMGFAAVDALLEGKESCQMTVVRPSNLEEEADTKDMNGEGWTTDLIPLSDAVNKSHRRMHDELATSTCWWSHDIEFLQRITMGPPYYDDQKIVGK